MTGKASARPAQYAAGLVRSAECSPRPPRWAGSVARLPACGASASVAPPRHCLRVRHMAWSWARAYARISDGGTVRKAWFARGDAHICSNNQEHCKSGSFGSWRSSRSSSSRRRAAQDWTKSGWPIGVPSTTTPRWSGRMSPRQKLRRRARPCLVAGARRELQSPSSCPQVGPDATVACDGLGSDIQRRPRSGGRRGYVKVVKEGYQAVVRVKARCGAV